MAAVQIVGLMKSILFGIDSGYVHLVLGIAGTALAAATLPLLRALKADPIESLRAE